MRLLLIDDEESNLKSMQEIIKPSGHTCDTFNVPGEGIEAYKSCNYDLVITDLMMPEISGLDVLREIKNFDRESLVAIITGNSEIDYIIEAVNIGVYAFLRKPLNIENLMEILTRVELEKKIIDEKDIYLNRLILEFSKLKNNFENFLEMFEKLMPHENSVLLNKKNRNFNKRSL